MLGCIHAKCTLQECVWCALMLQEIGAWCPVVMQQRAEPVQSSCSSTACHALFAEVLSQAYGINSFSRHTWDQHFLLLQAQPVTVTLNPVYEL